jgi:hypothetical protein
MGESIIMLLALGGVGGLLIVIGLFIWMRTRSFLSTAQQAKGTVVRMDRSSGSDGVSYAPVFQFRTITGQTVEVAEKLYSNPPQFQTGQDVDILYDPQDPQRARVNKGFNLYFVPILLGGLGFIFLCLGIVIFGFQVVQSLT